MQKESTNDEASNKAPISAKRMLGDGFVDFDSFFDKPVLRIYFEWWAGNLNMGFWTGDYKGDVIDYHLKNKLIDMAKEKGWDYVVFRHHKGKLRGKVSILETSLSTIA